MFSVIMPNYNNGKYIKEAIDSVRRQTYKHWELVIVDDASTDDSLEIIRPFLIDSRIKLIRNDVNKGVAHAAKLAVENSSGELIGTLDSDDVLDENAVMVMVNESIADPEIGLFYSNYYKCDNDLNVLGKVDLLYPLPDNVSLQEILLGRKYDGTISWHFRAFRRSAYDKTEGYDTRLFCYEDRDIYYKLEKVTKIKCINKCLLYYRDATGQGAYRKNPLREYYWFICEYKETKRRLGINLPLVKREKIPLFLANLIYIYMRKSVHVRRDKLRERFRSFFLGQGYIHMNTNKLMALLYIFNSFFYGYTPITLDRLKKVSGFEFSNK